MSTIPLALQQPQVLLPAAVLAYLVWRTIRRFLLLLLLLSLFGMLLTSATTTTRPDRQPPVEVVVFREIGSTKNPPDCARPATNKGEFRVDPTGLSTFEEAYLPGARPCLLKVVLTLTGPPGPVARATVVGMPGCTALRTPPGDGHWEILCPGDPKLMQAQQWSLYAGAAKAAGTITANQRYASAP